MIGITVLAQFAARLEFDCRMQHTQVFECGPDFLYVDSFWCILQ